MNNTVSFLDYHMNLTGYNVYFKEELIPRYMLYYKGIDTDKLLLNKTKYTVKERE